MGKIAMPQKVTMVKIIVNGVLKDSNTKKIRTKEEHLNLKLFYIENQQPITIDPKMGEFELEKEAFSEAKTIIILAD